MTHKIVRSLDLNVSRLTVPEGHKGLFMARVPTIITTQQANRICEAWNTAWQRAGHEPAHLLVLPGNIKITPLDDAELKHLGLMRIAAAA